ncbi:MAG: radical SAM protein [Bacteroidota bacterium]
MDRRTFFRLAGGGLTSFLFFPAVTDQPRNIKFFRSVVAENNESAMSEYTPSYVDLHRKGILKERAGILKDMMQRCTLCPRECETDRLRGRRGDCNARDRVEIASVAPHFGEEDELVGEGGSGTIFFTNCSLLCVFCINADISQGGHGREQSDKALARAMLKVQEMGCHNLNLVTPTHYAAHIVSALDIAAGEGLRLPVVYNTCGWEKTEILRLLDGVVDVYLADFKYYDPEAADKYSPGASSYPEITKKALLEMNDQVGVARADPDTGLINRGLMIRHLVMPNNVCDSDKIMRWIGKNLPKDTYVNIMSQYAPVHKADEYPEIDRRITTDEYRRAVKAARDAGLRRAVLQTG